MIKGFFDTCMNGAGGFADSAWFFRGGDYIRVHLPDMSLEQASKPIVGNWGQFNTWPADYVDGVDAVLVGQGAYLGKAWFFKGPTYIRYDLAADRAETPPKPIVGNWGQFNTWPAAYANGIDAVLAGRGPYAGKAWFFKGNTYILYDLAADRAETPPTTINSMVWAGGAWPSTTCIGGIDLTFYSAAGTAVIVRGGMAFECDLATNSVVAPPYWIEDRWPQVVDALYQPHERWGVDSLEPVTKPMPHGQSLFDYVVDHCGIQPRFWGRYIDALTPAEAAYIHDRGVRILPIFRGTGPHRIQGDRDEGRRAADEAMRLANGLGIPNGAVIFLNIEPAWHPSTDFLMGWWERFEPSQYYEGLYANPSRAHAPFSSTYERAYPARLTHVPPMNASTLIWSQQPQKHCASARSARTIPFAPTIATNAAGETVNVDCHSFWQVEINQLPYGAHGLIDHDLATTQFFDWLW